MEALDLLTTRSSSPRLEAPGPGPDALERMFQAALRAPDHARLRPWEFVVIEGDARARLGQLIADSMAAEKPASTAEELERARGLPLRAPLLIAVVARLREHPKVPAEEQLLSAGCSAHALLLAANAQGFGGIWRTGFPATSPGVRRGLGLGASDVLVGYLYLGTPAQPAAVAAAPDPAGFVRRWGA